MTQLFVDERDQSTVPGGLQEHLVRKIPGLGTIEFEYAPVGYLKKTKPHDPRLVDWRAYYFTPEDGKRRQIPSVTTWLGQILPKDLSRYGEEHGAIGAVEAVRRREIDPDVHDDEDVVEIVRALRLGVDAATNRAASRGVDVHKFLEEFGKTGRMPRMDVPLELAGYVKALQHFLEDFDPEPVAVEQLVADPDRGFAGRLDLKAVIRSEHLPTRELRVCDLKTSPKLSIWPGAHLQTMAYRIADMKCGGEESATPLIVVVDAEGRYAVQDSICSEDQLDAGLSWYRAVKPIDSHCSSRHYRMRKAA